MKKEDGLRLSEVAINVSHVCSADVSRYLLISLFVHRTQKHTFIFLRITFLSLGGGFYHFLILDNFQWIESMKEKRMLEYFLFLLILYYPYMKENVAQSIQKRAEWSNRFILYKYDGVFNRILLVISNVVNLPSLHKVPLYITLIQPMPRPTCKLFVFRPKLL